MGCRQYGRDREKPLLGTTSSNNPAGGKPETLREGHAFKLDAEKRFEQNYRSLPKFEYPIRYD
jgi:hypothetical protein